MIIAIIILSIVVLILGIKLRQLELTLLRCMSVLNNALNVFKEIDENNRNGHQITADVLKMIKTIPCLQDLVEKEIQINSEPSKSTNNNKKQKKGRNVNVKVDVNEKCN